MQYFKNFPNTTFSSIIDNENANFIVTNLVTRVQIRKGIKNNLDLYDDYSVTDSDTFDSISFNYYRSIDYAWLIMLMNDFVDPYTSLPLKPQQLNAFLDQKYAGYTCYIANPIGNFIEGETIVTSNGSSSVVIHWDLNMFELSFDSDVTGEINLGDIVTGQTSGAIGLITRGGVNGEYIPHRYAIHHFETEEGAIIDPRTYYNRISSPGYESGTGINQAYAYLYASGTGNTIVETAAVNNMTYEFRENEKKRHIKLLKPEFLTTFIDEWTKLLGK